MANSNYIYYGSAKVKSVYDQLMQKNIYKWSENNTMPLKKSDTTSCLSIQMTVDILVFLVGNTELNCYDDKSEHTFKVLTINF